MKNKAQKIKALDNINLEIRDGEIFGLLGPNGAGKTTFVSIMTTLLKPTSGSATILGLNILKNPKIIRRKVGLMLGGDMIYYRLTGYQNLEFFCRVYGIKDYKQKINDLVEKLNLTSWKNEFVSVYSTGMKVKLALARVLLLEPEVFFLDEPMLGLDPNSVKEIMEHLRNLNKTIILTSHQMNVVERLCDRIAFLKKGKILHVDTQENFKKLITDEIKISVQIRNDNQEFLRSLESKDYISNIELSNDNNVSFNIFNRDNFPDLFNVLKSFPIISFKEVENTLDDVFIKFSK